MSEICSASLIRGDLAGMGELGLSKIALLKMAFDFFYAMRYALPVFRSLARRDEGWMRYAIS